MKKMLVIAGLLGGLLALPQGVQAQSTRTWVSGTGDDANPCSRTAPCKTFVGAVMKTAAGGEINCFDPGGFGAVTISRSIAIVCELGWAGSNGVTINAGPSDVVYLRGLDITGLGAQGSGVNFVSGGALHVSNTVIHGFSGAPAILVAPKTGTVEVFVADTTVRDNLCSNCAAIYIAPTGSGSVNTEIERSIIVNNGGGVRTNGQGGSGGLTTTLRNSVSSQNTSDGVASVSNGAAVRTYVIDSSINNNGVGLSANGSGAALYLARSLMTNNSVGVAASGGTVYTYGDSRVINNVVEGATMTTVGPSPSVERARPR